jgi:hypothetical protein
MADARKRDQADLIERLDMLASNDVLIFEALQEGEKRMLRLEELLIAFTKVRILDLDQIASISLFCDSIIAQSVRQTTIERTYS